MKYAIMNDVHAKPEALKKAYVDACERKCGKFAAFPRFEF
jgi:hypothetical protein